MVFEKETLIKLLRAVLSRHILLNNPTDSNAWSQEKIISVVQLGVSF